MFRERCNKGSIHGFQTKEDAIAAIQSTPLLEDVSLWTHWDDVFRGEPSKLGDLKSFLENEGILMNAGKSTSANYGPLVVIETSPGVLLRLTTITSIDLCNQSINVGDAVGAAGHLASMVVVNGGVSNTPVALLANHVQSSLASMAAREGHDRCSDFVLNCLVRLPSNLAQTVGAKVFSSKNLIFEINKKMSQIYVNFLFYNATRRKDRNSELRDNVTLFTVHL